MIFNLISHFILDETIESSLASTTSSNINKDSKDSNNNSAINNESNGRSAALERAYVHDVYENCEEPVGSIRPRVASFLSALDAGSIVCDVGCGNGRYLTTNCNPSIVSIGVDRCFRLGNVAKESGGEVSCHLKFQRKFVAFIFWQKCPEFTWDVFEMWSVKGWHWIVERQ